MAPLAPPMLTSVAVEEMGHLAAVWNITSALGGSPARTRPHEFPAGSGLTAGEVWSSSWRRSPAETLQHFVFLEAAAWAPPSGTARASARSATISAEAIGFI